MDELAPTPSQTAAPKWRPISAIDRRIIGVLIEKAKTTPDVYPMSVNSLRSGANQKNNRFPLMELEIEDIEESLERLRGMGAVTEVQGGGRIPRFRHHLYEWLGADKVELAVMGELLLRGAQTEGELRGRAARMDPIPDLAALRPILVSLAAKKLIVSLSPEGRGHVLTHALYEPREMEKLRAEHDGQAVAAPYSASPAQAAPSAPVTTPPRDLPQQQQPNVAPASARPTNMASPAAVVAPPDSRLGAQVAELRQEVDDLRDEVTRLRREMDDLLAQLR
jgi:uncharacterized protein YceH (UPF0502 family)